MRHNKSKITSPLLRLNKEALAKSKENVEKMMAFDKTLKEEKKPEEGLLEEKEASQEKESI